MNFGQALEALKAGKRVAREGWNGKGMWLVLVRGRTWASAAHGPHWGLSIAGSGADSWPEVSLLPWIGMKTADDGFVPWLASQTDLLAEDWVEAV